MFLKTDLRLKTSHLDLRAVNDLDELSPCSQLLELALQQNEIQSNPNSTPFGGRFIKRRIFQSHSFVRKHWRCSYYPRR